MGSLKLKEPPVTPCGTGGIELLEACDIYAVEYTAADESSLEHGNMVAVLGNGAYDIHELGSYDWYGMAVEYNPAFCREVVWWWCKLLVVLKL